MQRRRGFVGVFLFFLFIAILLFFAFRTAFLSSFYGFLQLGTIPLQRAIHTTFWSASLQPETDEKLTEENRALRERLVKFEEMKRENSALRDQYETTEMEAYTLIPAKIVGSKGFIPGVSLPEQIVIDKGMKEGIRVGNAVVYKNNVMGKVVTTSSHVSVVDPITKLNVSFSGKDLKTGALGVVKGKGDGIVLENVVLSDKLQEGDLVITKGDVDGRGNGIPPELVVGKITSIDRRPSNLFQSAEVMGLIDITNLTTVFVLQSK